MSLSSKFPPSICSSETDSHQPRHPVKSSFGDGFRGSYKDRNWREEKQEKCQTRLRYQDDGEGIFSCQMWHEFQLKPLYYVTWQNLLSFQCNCHSFCLFFFTKKGSKRRILHPLLSHSFSLSLISTHFTFHGVLFFLFPLHLPLFFSVLNMKRKQNGNFSEFLSILVLKREGRKRRTKSNLLNGKTSWRQDRKRIKKRRTKWDWIEDTIVYSMSVNVCCFVAFFVENLTSFLRDE